MPGGRVRLGFIGVGAQGRAQLGERRSRLRRGARALRHQPGAAEARRRRAREERHASGATLRRLERDAAEGRCRGGHHGAAAVGACRPRRRLPRGRQARPLREDDGLGRRRLRADARGRARNGKRARNRLPAQLQPDVPGGLRRDHQDRHAWGHLPRAAGLAPQRQLAAQGGAAVAGLRPVEVGLSRLRSPVQLAACTGSTRRG